MPTRRNALLCMLGLGTSLSAGLVTHAFGQTGSYPERPIRFIVPYSAGGTTDVIARVTAEAMSKSLGQPVIIENRPGAGVTLGSGIVAKAPADGYTILVTTLAHAINPSLFRKLPYDSDRDFQPIGMVGAIPLALVVNPKLEVTDLKSFIELLRKNPGKYSFGSAGTGSPMHVAPELFKTMTGTDVTHVPYKGEAPVLNDIIGGHVTFAINPLTAGVPHVRAGSLRALGVASARRAPNLPDVPTISEAGLPGFEAYTWNVLMAPAGTPRPIIDILNRETNKALHDPAVSARLAELSVEVDANSTPESTAEFIRAETAKWAPIIKASGAVIE